MVSRCRPACFIAATNGHSGEICDRSRRQTPGARRQETHLSALVSDMNTFHLDETDFGIDESKSSCSIDIVDGIRVINVEIRGDSVKYDAITQSEDSQWSWTLYPPRLYIYDFPLSEDGGFMRAKISRDDLDEYEAAIYLIEHNDIDDVELTIDGNGALQVRGIVFLSGRPHPFSAHYTAQS